MKKVVKYLSFGSPLLDIIGDIDNEFISKHNIIVKDSIHMKMKDISYYNEFSQGREIVYLPGGCQFNAMRIFKWMHKETEEDKDKDQNSVGFLGSVGGDTEGLNYQNLLIKEGITPIFEMIPKNDTGRCLVLCKDRDRIHITDLGASVNISEDFVNNNWSLIEDAKLIYTELYIIRDRIAIAKKIAKLGIKDDKIYGFNLPAPGFISEFFADIYDFIQSADVIFANIDEATFFATILREKDLIGSFNDTQSMLTQLAMLPKKNPNKCRVIAVTSGPKPAWVCQYDFNGNKETICEAFDVFDVPTEKIIDTNGAGDSFAGGFLSQYVNGASIKECMKAGLWAAHIIIQQRGFNIPYELKYDEELHIL